ncbi:MAG TPA: M64 family metallopeptidase [Woeseiaceae bacterium]|nr:M64 family metallopeptidase [Woeseiaceae bacterium]
MKTAAAVLFAGCCTVTAYAEETVQTMRLDYYHSGNAESETFSIDELVLEPLPFPGNLAQPKDKTLRGKYAFEILDKESGALLWSRSFSSIYGEWETTAEAKRIDRTFHESLRFPAPPSEFRVVIRKRGADNSFVTVWETGLDPDDYLVHRESAPYRDDVTAIQYNGDPRNKVDLLLLGDGYTADEIGTFLERAKELTEVFLSTSPFRERRSDFNVWALAPPARESGVSRPSTGTYRDSPIGATYDAFRSERYVLTYDNKAWRQIASSAPYDFVEILTNSDTYGGGGIYGLYSTAAAHSEWAAYLFVHEFGHHFAGLADEYYTSSVAYEAPGSITEPYEPNVTALLDPARLKWKPHTESATPIPTPWPKEAYEEHSLAYQARRAQMRAENVAESEMNQLFREDQEFSDGLFSTAPYRDAVGAFEGANYQSKGYYRSEMNCIMFTRSNDFCRVCSDAIEQVIDEYTRSAE